MSKISLKVIVAGRSYPLNIEESEEKKVLKAADDINNSIKLLQDNYAVKDMQDLLAMTALQLATKSSTNVSQNSQENQVELTEIDNTLQEILEELK